VRVRKQIAITRPVARAEGLLIESVGEETVVYDLDTKEAHCLKTLAATVFAYADGSNTASDIAELASYRLATPVTEADVVDAVKQLESCSLLDTGPIVVHDGLSRRDAIKRFGMVAGVATATPLIATVMAPAASAAGSKQPTGSCCGSPKDNCAGGNPLCDSGHCCQRVPGKSCNQCKCVGAINDCEDDKCTGSPTGCPTVKFVDPNDSTKTVDVAACGKSGNRCCYPPSVGSSACCTTFPTLGGVVISC
jgi:hypothetical protein